MSRGRKVTLGIVAVTVVGAGVYYFLHRNPAPQVLTQPITRGDVEETVGATGALEAVNTVQVGTQVSGSIQDLYADFNSPVRKGQVIARLDPSLFQTQVEQARANVSRSEADLDRLRLSESDALRKLERARKLGESGLIPATDLDTAEATYLSASAQVRSAEAQVMQARASLNQAEVSLEKTVIAAPISGIVIARNVDVGQTVAASLQAPTLFVIAADLTKMRVNASIHEADIGRIRPGQVVRFRVDSYPADEFPGTVSLVRLNPVVQQNVVTYATVIDVPNPRLKLKPGMTATVTIQIESRQNVLLVPNAALRFRPTAEMFAALNQPVPSSGDESPAAGSRGAWKGAAPDSKSPTSVTPSNRAKAPAEPAAELFGPLVAQETVGRVWVFGDQRITARRVRLGITDGTRTELRSSDLPESTEVVTNVVTGSGSPPASATTTNPLMPQRRAPGAGGPK
ncbi:MAG: efflux RND transporter periplasmic adaptor subunit [Acidobacteriia bacterium]|nr:efflux RND transporter periplasmic adaptor subunit [Terriglobia bacterium]